MLSTLLWKFLRDCRKHREESEEPGLISEDIFTSPRNNKKGGGHSSHASHGSSASGSEGCGGGTVHVHTKVTGIE